MTGWPQISVGVGTVEPVGVDDPGGQPRGFAVAGLMSQRRPSGQVSQRFQHAWRLPRLPRDPFSCASRHPRSQS